MYKNKRLGFAQVKALLWMDSNSDRVVNSKREIKRGSGVTYDTIDRLINRDLIEIDEENGTPSGHGSVQLTSKGVSYVYDIKKELK